MSRAFPAVLPFLAAFAAAALLGAGACADREASLGAGSRCFLASECAPGLVCVPQEDGTRVCSSDLRGVQGEPPAPAPGSEAGAPVADAGEADDSGTTGGNGNPGGARDAGGTPRDAGGSPRDAAPEASPSPDAGDDDA